MGCGRIGTWFDDCHARAYKENPKTELVALCDTDAEKAHTSAQRWHVPAIYETIELMVQAKTLDIISICTPPQMHLSHVKKCLIAPSLKGIYLEKPIALTVNDAKDIIRLCDMKEVLLQVNHQRRFVNPKFRFARGIINTGTHGFDLLVHLFGQGYLNANASQYITNFITVDIEYLDNEDYIFELDCTHNKDRMIPSGVRELIKSIEENRLSISSGDTALKALELCLEFGRKYGGKTNKVDKVKSQ